MSIASFRLAREAEEAALKEAEQLKAQEEVPALEACPMPAKATTAKSSSSSSAATMKTNTKAAPKG